MSIGDFNKINNDLWADRSNDSSSIMKIKNEMSLLGITKNSAMQDALDGIVSEKPEISDIRQLDLLPTPLVYDNKVTKMLKEIIDNMNKELTATEVGNAINTALSIFGSLTVIELYNLFSTPYERYKAMMYVEDNCVIDKDNKLITQAVDNTSPSS